MPFHRSVNLVRSAMLNEHVLVFYSLRVRRVIRSTHSSTSFFSAADPNTRPGSPPSSEDLIFSRSAGSRRMFFESLFIGPVTFLCFNAQTLYSTLMASQSDSSRVSKCTAARHTSTWSQSVDCCGNEYGLCCKVDPPGMTKYGGVPGEAGTTRVTVPRFVGIHLLQRTIQTPTSLRSGSPEISSTYVSVIFGILCAPNS